MEHMSAWSSRSSERIYLASSSAIRTRGSLCTFANKSQSRSCLVLITCIVVVVSFTLVCSLLQGPLREPYSPAHIPPDLKPENVLICIDDVEAVIQAELQAQSASATPPPTRLIGVPPSRGRGGNQTPRSESVFITGSQPLPSPSSSYGSTSHLDRWAFGMSKIDGDASKPGSVGSSRDPGAGSSSAAPAPDTKEKRADSTELAAERISNVTLESSPFGEKVRLSPGKGKAAGPSLLTQQAPPHQAGPALPPPPLSTSSSTQVAPYSPATASGRQPLPAPPLSTSAMSVDGPVYDGTEKITVKIADLGNGEFFLILP